MIILDSVGEVIDCFETFIMSLPSAAPSDDDQALSERMGVGGVLRLCLNMLKAAD